MKLKLAEYKDGVFYQFLELGKDFLYAGDFILKNCLANYDDDGFEVYWTAGDRIEQGEKEEYYGRVFKKDKADPLNRFDGLFDGRTYGKGRFVLLMGFEAEGSYGKEKFRGTLWQDDIYHIDDYRDEGIYRLIKYNTFTENCNCCGTIYGFLQSQNKVSFVIFDKLIGHLHESTGLELFERLDNGK